MASLRERVNGDVEIYNSYDVTALRISKDGFITNNVGLQVNGLPGVTWVQVALSNAQFNALKTTPVTLAQGVPGKILRPIWAMYGYTVQTAYPANPSVKDMGNFGSGYMPVGTNMGSTSIWLAGNQI